MTCDICGTGFINKRDVLIHGCKVCNKGFRYNYEDSKNLNVTASLYCSSRLRAKLYKRHSVSLEWLQEALRGSTVRRSGKVKGMYAGNKRVLECV